MSIKPVTCDKVKGAMATSHPRVFQSSGSCILINGVTIIKSWQEGCLYNLLPAV
jgi:hypothetical protein